MTTPLAQMLSAGVPLWHGDEPSDQIVACADKAPYQAKQAGHKPSAPSPEADGHLTQ
jgi:hypothetical protein